MAYTINFWVDSVTLRRTTDLVLFDSRGNGAIREIPNLSGWSSSSKLPRSGLDSPSWTMGKTQMENAD